MDTPHAGGWLAARCLFDKKQIQERYERACALYGQPGGSAFNTKEEGARILKGYE